MGDGLDASREGWKGSCLLEWVAGSETLLIPVYPHVHFMVLEALRALVWVAKFVLLLLSGPSAWFAAPKGLGGQYLPCVGLYAIETSYMRLLSLASLRHIFRV